MSFLNKKFHISSGREIQPDKQAVIALTAGFLLAISPHIGRLPVWFGVLAVIVFLWKYKTISSRRYQPGRIFRLLALILVMFFLFQHYHTLLGRDAGVAMLILLTMLKFLELRDLRDYMLVVFLCMLIVLTSFLYSQSIWLGFYLLAIVIILFSVMMYLNHRARQDLFGMLRRSASLVMMGMPVAILLFLLFPRLQGGLFALPGDSHAGLTGMSDTMKPGTINELNLSEKVAFRAEFTSQAPPSRQQYWRGLVLENYQQGVWRENKSEKIIEKDVRYTDDDVIEYSILQEATNQKWIFALDMPVKKPQNLGWGAGQTLRTTSLLRERQQLNLRSAISYRFTELTDDELAVNMDTGTVTGKRIVDLAERLYRQAGSDRNYIQAVLAYYKNNNFIYSLQPPLLGERPVESFMLDTRIGYCEHYASSFTMMMRLSGIPARIVIGYQGGEWNEQGGYLIVKQSDAHAWSEVWLDESGWIRIDPTAAVAPERIEYGLSAIRQLLDQGEGLGNLTGDRLRAALSRPLFERAVKDLKFFWDGVNTRWYKWVIGYGTENQISLLKWIGFKQANWRNLVILLVALIMAAVSIQAWVVFHTKKAVDPAMRQYQKYCQQLMRIGIARLPSEGPADYAHRVVRLRPDLQGAVASVTEAYIAIIYAGNSDHRQQQKLATAVRNFRPTKIKGTFKHG